MKPHNPIKDTYTIPGLRCPYCRSRKIDIIDEDVYRYTGICANCHGYGCIISFDKKDRRAIVARIKDNLHWMQKAANRIEKLIEQYKTA